MAFSRPTSPTDIANLALDWLKQDPVTDIVTPRDTTSTVLSRNYHSIRRKCLRAHYWNFAIKRTRLTPSPDSIPGCGYTHAYALPNDYIRYVELHNGSDNVIYDQSLPVDYTIEGNYILYNGEDSTAIELIYVSDVDNVARFDPLFVEYFAVELALKIATRYVNKASVMQDLRNEQRLIKQEAKTIDGQDRPPRRIDADSYSRVRRRARHGGTQFYGGDGYVQGYF